MLKIFAQPPGASAPDTHVFSFTSPNAARSEADAIKDALSRIIQAAKAATAATALPAGGASSAAMAMASAVSSTNGVGRDSNAWYDDDRLRTDVELQQSLLKNNPLLSKTLVESLRTKPESISNSQFTSQFWSARLNLLRAHAIEKSQTKGAYNVLSSIKPKTVDNAIRLSISKEQIQLIFNQHSLVKLVYDENVPKLSEETFWSRFFQSRLFKKLKGERILESDPTDAVLDKYLQHDEDAERARRLMASHVPHVIDVEGNEENHSQRKGNKPDLTMRPTSVDKVPIIRTLNTLSEKIMSHVAPNDIDPSEPIGMDEETFNSLALQDLRAESADNRQMLHIKDQSHFSVSGLEDSTSPSALLYSKQNPTKVLESILADLSTLSTNPDLSTTIGVDPDSDSDDDDGANPKNPHVGSRLSRTTASRQILKSISQQRHLQSHDPQSLTNVCLSSTLYDRLLLTHATTTEFVHHFYLAFLSGDPSRADEISKLVETLDRAMDRINAIAEEVEKERTKEVDKVKAQVREHYERTGKKVRYDYKSIGGGRKVVEELFGPTVKAIGVAGRKYRDALEREDGGVKG